MTDIRYDKDFDAWLRQQVAALRAKDWDALDIDHLVEEIEDLRKSERRAVRSHLGLLWLHLLKWVYEPEGRDRYGASRQATLTYTRAFIERSLEENPSLQSELARLAEEAYPWARRRAAKETRLPVATFPASCPWTLEQILDDDFPSEG